MLRYLYTLDYGKGKTRSVHTVFPVIQETVGNATSLRSPSLPDLALHASLYAISDKYGIKGLKFIAQKKFEDIMSATQWGELLGKPDTAACAIPMIAPIVEMIFTATPESDKGLRLEVLHHFRRKIKTVLHLEAFKDLLERVPEFSHQLLVQEVNREVLPSLSKKRRSDLVSRRNLALDRIATSH